MSDKKRENAPGEGWSNGDIHPTMFPVTRDGKLQLYAAQRRWIGLSQSWTRIGKGDALDARHSTSMNGAVIAEDPHQQARAVRSLIAQLCETFYKFGWATGTGGGISIRIGQGTTEEPFRVFVAPSGIQKEDMIGDDIFELDMDRNVVVPPKTPNLKQSACTPLWYVVYKHRPSARAVIHTHSMYAQMATLLDENQDTLRITHLEMLKGVGNHAFDDILQVPIIENRPTEDLLAEQLEQAVLKYPKTNAVLVRRHGLYVWGDSWEQAKTQCESFDYLFQSALEMKKLGIDPGKIPDNAEAANYRAEKKRKLTPTGFNGTTGADNDIDLKSNLIPLVPKDSRLLVLDIEGCTTSISFVHDKLFPYVRENLASYLRDNPDASDKYRDGLIEEVQQVDPDAAVDTSSISDLVTFLMDRDVKSATLKSLQGSMWKSGYSSGELRGHVYDDVPLTLEWCKSQNVHVYIYSSGSESAQKLLFGNSVKGDLLKFISGHFDIPKVGGKKEASSYTRIAEMLQKDPSDMVFVSDSEAELVAAREAGVLAVMSVRPGNAKISRIGRQFPTVYSLLQVCGS